MKMNILIISILALLLSTACSQPNKTEEVQPSVQVEKAELVKSSVTVKFLIGKAIRKSAGTESELKIGDQLNESDVVATGERSSVDLMYNDEGIIRIAEKTEFSISTLSSGESDSTKLKLNSGKVFVSVAKLKKGGLEVQTQTMVAAVRGTAFIVDAASDRSTLQVIKGSVKVNPVKDNQPLTGREVMTDEGKQITLQSKDASSYQEGTKELKTEPIGSRDVVKIDAFIKDISPESFPGLKDEAKAELESEVPAKVKQIKESTTVSATPVEKETTVAEPQGESEDAKASRIQRDDEEKKAREAEELRKKQEREAKESAVSIPSI